MGTNHPRHANHPFHTNHPRHTNHLSHKHISTPFQTTWHTTPNENINHNKIINYSNRPLNEQETNLLNLYQQSKCYVDSFINRMSTKYHLEGKPFTPHPFHKPSGWILPPPKNDNLNRFFPNVTLKQLQDDPNIIIKPADKGGAIVVLNTRDYHHKVLQILTDKTWYKQTTHHHIPTVRQEVQSLIDYLRIKGTIDDRTFTFLSPKNPPKTPMFYWLPKVHKLDCPLRHIVSSANDSPTENISSYVNHFLQHTWKHFHRSSKTLNISSPRF